MSYPAQLQRGGLTLDEGKHHVSLKSENAHLECFMCSLYGGETNFSEAKLEFTKLDFPLRTGGGVANPGTPVQFPIRVFVLCFLRQFLGCVCILLGLMHQIHSFSCKKLNSLNNYCIIQI